MEPELLLPFRLSREDARAALEEWLGAGGWLTPGDLARRSAVAELRGVYLPFWSFSMRSESEWTARIGEDWYETVVQTYTAIENGKPVTRTRTVQVKRTEWYPLAGRFHQFHSGYLVSASKGLPQAIADAIGPFPTESIARYAPSYLAGWLCEEYCVEREEAARVSEGQFQQRETEAIRALLPGDSHDDLRVSTRFSGASEDLILLPIWILAYRYGDRVYRFVLNGATGKAHGERPTSGSKVALLVIALCVFIALVVLGFYFLSRR